MNTLRSILTSSGSGVRAWVQNIDLKTSISSKLVSSWGGIQRRTPALLRQRLPVFRRASNPQSIEVALGEGRQIKHSGSVNLVTRGFPYKTTISMMVLGGYIAMGYVLSNIQDLLQEGKVFADIQVEYIRGIKDKFPEAINHIPRNTIRESLEYNMNRDDRGITFVYGPSGTGKTSTIIRVFDDLIHDYKGTRDNVSDTLDTVVTSGNEAGFDSIQPRGAMKNTHFSSSETLERTIEKEAGIKLSEPDQEYRFVIVDLKRFDEAGVERSTRRFLFECAYHYYESLFSKKGVHWWAWFLLPCRLFFRSNDHTPWWNNLVDNFKHIYSTAKAKQTCVEEVYHMLEVAKKLYSYHMIPNRDATVIDQEVSNSSSLLGLLTGLLFASHAFQDIQYISSLFTCAMDMLRHASSAEHPTILTILDGQNVALLRRFGKVLEKKLLDLSTTDLYLSIARNILDFFSSPSSNSSRMQLVIETSDCAAGLAFLDMQAYPIVKVLVDGWWNEEFEDQTDSPEKHELSDMYAQEMACDMYYWLRYKAHKLVFPTDRERIYTQKREIFDELSGGDKELLKSKIKSIYKRIGLHASDWYTFAWYFARHGVGNIKLLEDGEFQRTLEMASSKADRTIQEQAGIDLVRARRTYCVYSATTNWTREKDNKTFASNGSMWGLRRMSNAGEHFLPYFEDSGPCSTMNFIKAIKHARKITKESKTLQEAKFKAREESMHRISITFTSLLTSPEAMGLSHAGIFAIFPTTTDIGELFRLQRPSLEYCVSEIEAQYVASMKEKERLEEEEKKEKERMERQERRLRMETEKKATNRRGRKTTKKKGKKEVCEWKQK